MSQNLNRFFRIYLRLAALTLVVCTLLRIVLLFNEQTSELGFGFLQWVVVFGLGALNDLCALTLGYVFLWLFLLTLSKRKYDRPTGYVLLGVLTAAFCYVAFCNTIFDEYGSAAPLVATIVLGYWAGSFALRLFVPRLQPLWSKGWLAALLAIYVGAILFNAVSEYYFWNEFGVRYNFIAVDYLVYTNEVVGNIMESYPIVPLATLIVALTVAVTWWLFRRDIRAAVNDALASVHAHQCAHGVRRLHDRTQIGPCAERVGCLRDGYHARAAVDQSVESFGHQPSRIVEGQHPQFGPLAQRDRLPRNEVRMVLHLAHDDIVARPQERIAPCVGHRVERCRRPRREDHLLAVRGADKGADTVARRFVTLRRLLGQTMYAAVDIGVQLQVQVIDRIDHATRLLRRSPAIEVDQRAAVYLGREQRKIRTYLFNIKHSYIRSSFVTILR